MSPNTEAVAARLTPDRATRWLSYWDTFSSTIPDEITDAEYSDLVLGAWLNFRKHDDSVQADTISAAWGIRRFKKLPRLQPRVQPTATVVPQPVKPWVPCVHWGGTRTDCVTCSKGEPHAQRMRYAQDMWTDHARFVRQRLRAEILPWTGGVQYEHFIDLEAQFWFNVAARIESYLPMMNSAGEAIPQATKAWLRAVVHSTVTDHFRAEWGLRSDQSKRDVRREVQFLDTGDRGIPNPGDPMFAKPVSPAGSAPDEMEVDV